MKSDSDAVVSITKVTDSIESAVQEAINLLGGMDSLVNEGDKVYLKPNFVAPRNASTGVTTNFEVIRAVAAEVRRFGGIPILYETPAYEFDKEILYDFLGVPAFAQQNQIELTDGHSELIKVQVPNGRALKSLQIPEILHQAKIINLPKLKTHVSTRMTCGLKNLIGLLPDFEKRNMHVRGINAAIADMSKVLQPILTVVDAITCVEGDGPTYGDPVDLNLIAAGRDHLVVDKICSQIIGLPWEEVAYLRLSDAERGHKGIKIVGQALEDVKTHLRIPEKGAFYHLSVRMIHALDIIFSKIFNQHLNEFLFGTGYFGTNPKILRDNCDRCGHCVEVCPVEDVINLDTYKVDYKNCIRCLDCYCACDRNAMSVKGFSRPESH